jgi:hypothetical protein
MATYGAKALTRIAAMSQSGFGTAAAFGTAAGEILFNETLGALDLGVTVDLGETTSVGKRTAIQAGRPTITGRAPVLTIAEGPASLRTLPLVLDAIGASVTGSGPYTWTWSPTQGDVDTLVFYSFLVEDGVQKYRVSNAAPTEITFSADASGLLQMGATFAATTVESSALAFGTALPANPMMAGRLMKLSTDTNFPDKTGTGATDYTSVMNFSLSIMTGVGMITALDGSLTAATAALTGVLDATLTFTVASNSGATTSFPITDIATQKYLRLYGVTSDNYGVWVLGSWEIENITPLGADVEGVVTNEVVCRLAYDVTSGKSLEIIVDSPLATAP